jgi:REP element-mobilizing transposase RayT
VHFIWCPKRRKQVLVNQVGHRCEEPIRQKRAEHGWFILDFAMQPDHSHLFFRAWPSLSAADIVKECKGFSAFMLRKEFPELHRLPSLWTRSYFASTAGTVVKRPFSATLPLNQRARGVGKDAAVLTLDYKLDGTLAQYAAIDEGIRVVQFVRNKCLQAWMDRLPEGKSLKAMSAYTVVLATEFAFAGRLGSQARQASAKRAWLAVSRFYENCQNHVPGKKGYPQFQHDCRSIEYKDTSGWSLAPDGMHITFTDSLGIGTVRLIGTGMRNCDAKNNKPLRSPAAYPLASIKRVRIIRRADGYFCQFCLAVCRVQHHEETGIERGIDVGLNAYYTDSEGEKVENPRFFRTAERKVARLQRQVSRKSVRHKEHKKPKSSRKHNKYPKGLSVVKQAREPHKQWHTHPKSGQTIHRHQRPTRVMTPVVNQNTPKTGAAITQLPQSSPATRPGASHCPEAA